MCKRWYNKLTKKQKKVALIVAIIFIILFISFTFFIIIFKKDFKNNEILSTIIFSFINGLILNSFLYFVIYEILWGSSHKKKDHDKIISKVRERFELGPIYKEVLYVPVESDYSFIDSSKISNELEVKYFVKEIDEVIFVSVRNSDEEELTLQRVDDYYFFDLNFKPKD